MKHVAGMIASGNIMAFMRKKTEIKRNECTTKNEQKLNKIYTSEYSFALAINDDYSCVHGISLPAQRMVSQTYSLKTIPVTGQIDLSLRHL
jgi:hypothetical protein